MYLKESLYDTYLRLKRLVVFKCPSCGRRHFVHELHKYRGYHELHCFYGWVFGVKALVPAFIYHVQRGFND